jgi:hypothetical protein
MEETRTWMKKMKKTRRTMIVKRSHPEATLAG